MLSLVLASTSPFRREQLNKLAVPYQCATPNCDETPEPGEKPQHLVERLAIEKARSVADAYPDSLIIGSDQVAVCEGEILGKPGNHQKAFEQLSRLSGNPVCFYTGLCLYNTLKQSFQVKVIPFEVVFRKLSATQIENYLLKDQPYNCAGSFKSEALGITLFKAMRGDDPSALIGLPLITLTDMLANEGMMLPLDSTNE